MERGEALVHKPADGRGAAAIAVVHAARCDTGMPSRAIREDRVDPPHRLGGERGTGDLGQLEQLASAMGPARCLGDRAGHAPRRVEFAEPGIGVGLQDALVPCQVPLRMLAGAVAGVAEHRRRRRRSGEGPVVADIGPEPPRDRPAAGQHRHGGVVAVQALCGEHVVRRRMLWDS
jgi:hypothetical protein